MFFLLFKNPTNICLCLFIFLYTKYYDWMHLKWLQNRVRGIFLRKKNINMIEWKTAPFWIHHRVFYINNTCNWYYQKILGKVSYTAPFQMVLRKLSHMVYAFNNNHMCQHCIHYFFFIIKYMQNFITEKERQLLKPYLKLNHFK